MSVGLGIDSAAEVPSKPLRVDVGVLFQIVHHQPSHSPSHSDAVVGASVLRVYLGGIGQVQALDRRMVVRHTLGIVGANYGLGRINLMVIAGLNP